MQACESERLGQVRFPLGPGTALARIDLEHQVAGEVVFCKVLQHPASLLVASAWHEVLVLGRPCPVGEMDMP